jgi:hypothetical protein
MMIVALDVPPPVPPVPPLVELPELPQPAVSATAATSPANFRQPVAYRSTFDSFRPALAPSPHMEARLPAGLRTDGLNVL